MGGGLAVAPLGFGLILGGITTAIGPEILETDGVPWISVLTGVGLGVLTFAVAGSLDVSR